MKSATGALAAFVFAAVAALPALPAAAADSGDTLFRRYCSVCHDTELGKNKLGPSLAGIVGRPSGDIADFSYSSAMQSAGITWDEKTIDQYIADPRALVPGNKMLFPGVKDPAERKAIIDYLKTLKS
jgi:cytochrome c